MANASARPMMMQLVIIRPTNTESCLLMSNKYAFRNWSATITSEAMIVSCTMIRIDDGM